MTNLYINGVAVVLPYGFYIRKAGMAFFTKNGEYTYDVVVDLFKDPVNAEYIGFLNRLIQPNAPKRNGKLFW